MIAASFAYYYHIGPQEFESMTLVAVMEYQRHLAKFVGTQEP